MSLSATVVFTNPLIWPCFSRCLTSCAKNAGWPRKTASSGSSWLWNCSKFATTAPTTKLIYCARSLSTVGNNAKLVKSPPPQGENDGLVLGLKSWRPKGDDDRHSE